VLNFCVVDKETPTNFMSISDFYANFKQVSDEEVLDILKKYA